MVRRIETDEEKLKVTLLLPESVVMRIRQRSKQLGLSQSYFIAGLVCDEEARTVVGQTAAAVENTVKIGEKAAAVSPETLEAMKELEDYQIQERKAQERLGLTEEEAEEAAEIYSELENLPQDGASGLTAKQLQEAVEIYKTLQKMPPSLEIGDAPPQEAPVLPEEAGRRITVIDQFQASVKSGHTVANIHEQAAQAKYGADWRDKLRKAQAKSERETDKEDKV